MHGHSTQKDEGGNDKKPATRSNKTGCGTDTEPLCDDEADRHRLVFGCRKSLLVTKHCQGGHHHHGCEEEQQRGAGITPEMVRLSVGLESIEDILADLEQALKKATA